MNCFATGYKIYRSVDLSLNGVTIPSEGYVRISDIYTDEFGLHRNILTEVIIADHPNEIAQGDWYYPDGSRILMLTILYPEKPNR